MQANAQILGVIKLVNFYVETSFDVVSTMAPMEEGAVIEGRGVLKLLGRKAGQRVLGVGFNLGENQYLKAAVHCIIG